MGEPQRIKNVLIIKGMSYQRYVPRCHLMVCHGGIGTVAHAINASIPVFVFPTRFD